MPASGRAIMMPISISRARTIFAMTMRRLSSSVAARITRFSIKRPIHSATATVTSIETKPSSTSSSEMRCLPMVRLISSSVWMTSRCSPVRCKARAISTMPLKMCCTICNSSLGAKAMRSTWCPARIKVSAKASASPSRISPTGIQ